MRDSMSRKSRSRIERPERTLVAYTAGIVSARVATWFFSGVAGRMQDASCSMRSADCSALISCAISLYREVQELRGRRTSRTAGSEAKDPRTEASSTSDPAPKTVDHSRDRSECRSPATTVAAPSVTSARTTAGAAEAAGTADWATSATATGCAGAWRTVVATTGVVRTGRFATFTDVLREAVLNGICTTTSATATAAVAGAIHFRLRTNVGRTRAHPCGRFTSAASCFWRRPRSNSAQNSGAGRSARLKRSSSSSVGRGDGCCGVEPMVSVSVNPANQPATGVWRSGDASGPFPPYTP